MARDYLEVYRRLVHTPEELSQPMPLATGPNLPGVRQGPGQRKLPRSHTPLLGALHRVGHHEWGRTA